MVDHPTDGFRYETDEYATLERFDVTPVVPTAIEERVASGEVLVTTDLPEYLDRSLAVESGTDTALYRLVELFGTPNVPGLEAGADQPERERTTWQYLFDVTFDPAGEGRTETYLLSIYDYETNLSVGLSRWRLPDEPTGRVAREPTGDPPAADTLPAEELLVALVKLTLNAVEEPVPATYEDLWI